MNILDQTEPASGARGGTFTFQVGANTGDAHKITHELDKLAFTERTGATFAAAVDKAPDSDKIQESVVTFGDDFTEGDVITVTANNKQIQYTVTAADASAASVGTAVATSFAQALGSTFSDLAVTVSSGDVTFKGVADQTFKTFAKVTDGKLATVEPLEITSQSLSDTAIGGLDAALTKVNEARAEIGAVINRLNYAVDNMTNVSMNTSESRSRILDTDYAKASAELARTQIISQAATAMLAQANQQPQAVLQLLQG
jgi:flagellin